MSQDEYFITAANFKALVHRSMLEVETATEQAYQNVYEKVSLKPYINEKEIIALNKQILFLEKTSDYLIGLESDARELHAGVGRIRSRYYVFDSGPPKYHSSDECKSLNKDFLNFLIPNEIRERGDDEIDRFKKFAEANKKLVWEGREDVLILRLRGEFKFKENIEKITISNSGSRVFSGDDGSDPVDVAVRIQNTIDEIEKIRSSEDGSKAISAYLYARPTNELRNRRGLSSIEREVVRLKGNLVEDTLRYNVLKHKGHNVRFSEKLLQLFGFQPCGLCCKSPYAL